MTCFLPQQQQYSKVSWKESKVKQTWYNTSQPSLLFQKRAWHDKHTCTFSVKQPKMCWALCKNYQIIIIMMLFLVKLQFRKDKRADTLDFQYQLVISFCAGKHFPINNASHFASFLFTLYKELTTMGTLPPHPPLTSIFNKMKID